MARVIRYFNKVDESYVGEISMVDIPLEKLQEIFQVSSDNPMYDSFPILEDQIGFIKEELGIDVDIFRYDYFLEYDG